MKKLLLSAAFVLAAAQAPAATVSHSDSHTATTNWTKVLSLPKFDPALGVLQQVWMELTGAASTAFHFENYSAMSRTAEQTSITTLSVTGPVSTALVIPFSVTALVGPTDGVKDWGGTAGYVSLQSDSLTQGWTWLAGSDDLGAFIGTNALALSVTANGATTSTSGSRASSISTTASTSVRISYAYSPAQAVPEPGSLALACMALGLFALLRRRA